MENAYLKLASTGFDTYMITVLALVVILSSYLLFRCKLRGSFLAIIFIFASLTTSLLPISTLSAQSADNCSDTTPSSQPPIVSSNAAAALDDGPFAIGTGTQNIVYVHVVNNDTAGTSTFDFSTLDLNPSTPEIDNDFYYSDGVNEGDFYHLRSDGIVQFHPSSPLTIGSTISIPYTIRTMDNELAGPANIIITVVDWIAQGDSIEFCGSDTDGSVDILMNDFHASGLDASTIDLDPFTPGRQTTVQSSDGLITFTLIGSTVYAELPTGGFSVPDQLADIYNISYTVDSNDGTTSNAAQIHVIYTGDCGEL